MVADSEWREVQNLLQADIENLDHEVEELYDDMERYARRASVLEDHGDSDDAEYFKELAYDSYESFVEVIQMKKDGDDYSF